LDGNSADTRPICKSVNDGGYVIGGGTNLGNPHATFHEYLKAQPDTVQKIEILITDGDATSSTPYDPCTPQNPNKADCRSAITDENATNSCVNEGIRFLECTITNTDNGGARPLNYDVYALTMGFDNSVPAQRVRNIFTDNS